jgi:hypothetical protein
LPYGSEATGLCVCMQRCAAMWESVRACALFRKARIELPHRSDKSPVRPTAGMHAQRSPSGRVESSNIALGDHDCDVEHCKVQRAPEQEDKPQPRLHSRWTSARVRAQIRKEAVTGRGSRAALRLGTVQSASIWHGRLRGWTTQRESRWARASQTGGRASVRAGV